jgi:hypothetical protein
LILIAAAVLVVVGAGDYLACRLLLARMRGAYEAWRSSVTAQGWTVQSGEIAGGGYPFGATLVIPGVTLTGGRAMVPGGLDWKAERVLLSLSLLSPLHLHVTAAGEQTLRVASLPAVAFSADDLDAAVPLGGGRPDQIDVTATDLTGGIAASAQHQDVRIDRFAISVHTQGHASARTSADITISGRNVQLPDNGRWPLGATITQLELSAALASPALSGQAPLDQARAWRDWGGTVNVSHLLLHWGPLTLSGHFTLGLDRDLQPTGSGEVTMAGWSPALDALAGGGVIPPGMAQTAKAVLALMSADNSGSLTVPLSLKDSTVSAGKIPVARVGRLQWAGG